MTDDGGGEAARLRYRRSRNGSWATSQKAKNTCRKQANKQKKEGKQRSIAFARVGLIFLNRINPPPSLNGSRHQRKDCFLLVCMIHNQHAKGRGWPTQIVRLYNQVEYIAGPFTFDLSIPFYRPRNCHSRRLSLPARPSSSACSASASTLPGLFCFLCVCGRNKSKII